MTFDLEPKELGDQTITSSERRDLSNPKMEPISPQFNSVEAGLEIVDPIERDRCRIFTPNTVSPEPINKNCFSYPVDSAVRIITNNLSLRLTNSIYVHSDGELVADVTPDMQLTLPKNDYLFDLPNPMKIYFKINSSVDIYSDQNGHKIFFGKPTSVIIGARSYHTQPAGTIETTANAEDVMRAVSAFGSALKTTSVERSFPTLRRHPPILTLGEEVIIPERFDPPETGIQIELPPDLRYVLEIAPLAYYLGAEIVPGPRSQLVTEDGFVISFEEDSFRTTVERILKTVFFLDCILRTEGKWPGPLYERKELERDLHFNISSTFDDPLYKKVEKYLQTPFELLEPHLPKWPVKTDLRPTPKNVEFLPYVVNDLSIIRAGKAGEKTSSGDNSIQSGESSKPTIRQEWNGIGSSRVTSTAPLAAFQNNFDQSPRTDPIEIVIVCNDPDMKAEFLEAHSAYGNHDQVPFDVTLHHDLQTGELRDVLRRDSDFFHYIGHVDQGGFRCEDGKFDASTVENAGPKAFLLNACRSYEQGLHLIEAGSLGGIVTVDGVKNKKAVSVGSTIAHLLNYGAPLYTAVNIVQEGGDGGESYHIIGNGKTIVSQTDYGNPLLISIGEEKGTRRLSLYSWTGQSSNIGAICRPHLDSVNEYHLIPKEFGPIPVSKAQLVEFLETRRAPVLLDGELRWSDEIKISEL